MTNQRPEDNSPPAGVSGSSATMPWEESKASDDQAAQNQPSREQATEVADSTAAALEQIDKLIGRLNSNTAASSAPPDIHATLPAGQGSADQGHAGHEHRHEDEALQDYMDQFLERVTGKKKPEPDSPAGTATVPLTAPASLPEPEKPREIKRAPESVHDMSAMRELANATARQALGAHAGQLLVGGTRTSFLGALSLSLISSLLALTSLIGQMAWAWNSSLLVMLLAAVLTWRFLRLRGKLQRLNVGHAAGSAV